MFEEYDRERNPKAIAFFKDLTKGAWIVIGVFLLFGGLFAWTYQREFLQGNVWSEHRINPTDRIQTQVDFLGLKVATFVEKSVGAAFTCLLVAFVYLAIQIRRLNRRLTDLDERISREKPS